MPNDAKLGMVVGVGLVILVAVIFFRKDLVTGDQPVDRTAATTLNPAASAPPAAPRNQVSPVKGKTMSRSEETAEAETAARQHTVEEGETLFSLAQRYYGDGDRFADIYRANRKVLKTPDALAPGTVLVIPHAVEEPALGESSPNP